jgi:hypothetical protein
MWLIAFKKHLHVDTVHEPTRVATVAPVPLSPAQAFVLVQHGAAVAVAVPI